MTVKEHMDKVRAAVSELLTQCETLVSAHEARSEELNAQAITLRDKGRELDARETKVAAREKSVSSVREELSLERAKLRGALEATAKEVTRRKALANENGVLKGQLLDLQRALRTLPKVEETVREQAAAQTAEQAAQ